MSIPKNLNAFNKELKLLCTNQQSFIQLLDELIKTKLKPQLIPDNWKTLGDVPRDQTFLGYHPQELDNEMIFLSPKHIAGKEIYMIGDLHGDKMSLDALLLQTGFFKKKTRPILIFLGDYFDRGNKSFETIATILLLKKYFPDHVFPLRGNHENGHFDPMTEEYSYFFSGGDVFSILSEQGYISQENEILEKIRTILPLAAVFGKTLCIHGGLGMKNPQKIKDIIADSTNVTWSSKVPRGIGLVLSFERMIQQISSLGFTAIVRGHEHENETKQVAGAIGYTLMSTGKGSYDVYTGYKQVTPSLLKYDQNKGFQIIEIQHSL